MYKKKYEDLRLTNDFIFAKIMRNERLCKKLLEVILGFEIDHIEYLEEQKTIDLLIDSKSIRLDVYAKDDRQSIYNIEMQTTNPGNLPKRSRYYQSLIDLDLIEKGANYNQLNKSYVIFICTEDIFHKGRHVYSFKNLCLEDSSIELKDETTKIFLNPISQMDDVDDELKNFLTYLTTGIPTDEFTSELETAVTIAKSNKKWRHEYMTLYEKELEAMAEGREEGRKEGREEGLKEGMDSICELLKLLTAADRTADIQLAINDAEARHRLLAEFGLDK
ncbi:MAG: Rpn family recombination-promoting nuclease/putative transposase [Lachnospiraceae bacterium]|nr:Rpn family recombination-promoting nuclease/putative transposase [Lachnospiraceae bacterium]